MDLSNIKLNPLELEDDQLPRPKSKLRFIIYFIIIVDATIAAFQIWKSHLQNPSTSVQVACSRTYKQRLCFDSASSLQRNSSNSSSNANPSKIFALSLQVGINQLNKMTPFFETLISKVKHAWTVQSLEKCVIQLNDSRSLLNMSLALIGDDASHNFFKETNVSSFLKERVSYAAFNIDKCESRLLLTELYGEKETRNDAKMKLKEVRFYIDNSYFIFCNIDEIYQQLNPSIGSIMHSHSVVTNLFLGLATYIVLGILIFLGGKAMYWCNCGELQ